MEEQHVSFLDYLYIWLKWRRLILWMAGITTVLAIGISLILPVYYMATTTILPPTEENPVGFPSSSLTTFSAGLEMFGIGKTEDLDTYMAILQSRRVRESVIRTFDLQTDYYDKETMDEALKAFDSDVDIETTKENTLMLSVVHQDSVKVAEIANFLIAELDRINKSLSNEQAHSNRLFIEGRIAKTRQNLHHAEEALKTYQEEHKTLGLSEENRSAILAGAELEAQVLALEVQRDVLRRTLGASHPALVQMGSQIEASQLRLADLPEIGLELARYFREVEIQTHMLTFLFPQYEQAKIQEARDTPTIQIIDRAVPPQRKHSPKRMFIVMGAFLSSLLVSLMLTLSLESIQQARTENNARGQRIEKILMELRILFTKHRG